MGGPADGSKWPFGIDTMHGERYSPPPPQVHAWEPDLAKPHIAPVPDPGTSEAFDPVARPIHYNAHRSGVECITITEHMNFCLGNAMKYIWRADLKGGTEDLRKAKWYLEREIARRESKTGELAEGGC